MFCFIFLVECGVLLGIKSLHVIILCFFASRNASWVQNQAEVNGFFETLELNLSRCLLTHIFAFAEKFLSVLLNIKYTSNNFPLSSCKNSLAFKRSSYMCSTETSSSSGHRLVCKSQWK